MKVFTSAVATIFLVGCSGTTGGITPGFNCDTAFDYGAAPRLRNGKIEAQTITKCRTPPDSHTLTLHLQRFQPDGGFASVSTASKKGRPGSTIKTWKKVHVEIRCRPGKYRAHAISTGTYKKQPYRVEASSYDRTFASC